MWLILLDGVQSDDSVAYGESRINYSSEDNPSSAGGGSIAMISIGGAVTGCLLVTTLVMISLIRWWNRRLITSRQNHNQDVLADDSDVRYLRDEDEVQLDLTEARPQSKFADFQQLWSYDVFFAFLLDCCSSFPLSFFFCPCLVFELWIWKYFSSSLVAMALFSRTVFAFHSMNFKVTRRFYKFLIRALVCNCKCWLGQQIRLIPKTSTVADLHALYRLKLPVFVSLIISTVLLIAGIVARSRL